MTAFDEAPASTSAEEQSKDDYFQRVADISNSMIEEHGKEFAMGTLVLAARFIAEGKPLKVSKSEEEAMH